MWEHQLNSFSTTRTWLAFLNSSLALSKKNQNGPLVLDLFAGCGGLALGFEASGFQTLGFEKKSVAAQTYSQNLNGLCEETELQVGSEYPDADVIIGGPPCQPFSIVGYQKGNRDSRDGFPIFLEAVHRKQPKLAIIENVRGLLYRNKRYLQAAIRGLESFGYKVDMKLLNATKFGVPQNRERLFIVASRIGWSWPNPVVGVPVPAGVALGKPGFDENDQFLTKAMDSYIDKYEKKSQCVNPRDLHFDRPSRTLTCRNLGGATSDMMRIRLPDGRRRMLRVAEASRLQSFPTRYKFMGSKYQQLEQIGNSVPPLMSLAIADQAMALFSGRDQVM